MKNNEIKGASLEQIIDGFLVTAARSDKLDQFANLICEEK